MRSILADAHADGVTKAPFPHLVIGTPRTQEEYRELADASPPISFFKNRHSRVHSNQAIRIAVSKVVDDPIYPTIWRAFFAYHTSQAFWNDCIRVFGDALRSLHPDIEVRAGKPFAAWHTEMNGESRDADVSLDVLYVINTPVTRPSSVRPPHVDDETKIMAGLFYMRAEDDDTPGEDLDLYALNSAPHGFGGHCVPQAMLRHEGRIEYAANRFVGLINGPCSVHGVTARPMTAHARRYINFYAQTPFHNLTLPRLSWAEQALFWIRDRHDKKSGITFRS